MTSSKPSVLHLHLHREFFAEIVAGTKRIEYRDQSPHWRRRLEGRRYDVILFRNGYATKAPEMLVEFLGVRKTTKSGRRKYAIRLGRILKIKRWKGVNAVAGVEFGTQEIRKGSVWKSAVGNWKYPGRERPSSASIEVCFN